MFDDRRWRSSQLQCIHTRAYAFNILIKWTSTNEMGKFLFIFLCSSRFVMGNGQIWNIKFELLERKSQRIFALINKTEIHFVFAAQNTIVDVHKTIEFSVFFFLLLFSVSSSLLMRHLFNKPTVWARENRKENQVIIGWEWAKEKRFLHHSAVDWKSLMKTIKVRRKNNAKIQFVFLPFFFHLLARLH